MRTFSLFMLCLLSSCEACGELPPPLHGQCRLLELRGADAVHKDCTLDGCRWDCRRVSEGELFHVPDWQCTLVSCSAEAR